MSLSKKKKKSLSGVLPVKESWWQAHAWPSCGAQGTKPTATIPKPRVKVPQGEGRERAARSHSTLHYFKHGDFILVCSEAAQMGRINLCYYRMRRSPRFKAARFSRLVLGQPEAGAVVCQAEESTSCFFFFLSLSFFKAWEYFTNLAAFPGTNCQIYLKNGTRWAADEAVKPCQRHPTVKSVPITADTGRVLLWEQKMGKGQWSQLGHNVRQNGAREASPTQGTQGFPWIFPRNLPNQAVLRGRHRIDIKPHPGTCTIWLKTSNNPMRAVLLSSSLFLC